MKFKNVMCVFVVLAMLATTSFVGAGEGLPSADKDLANMMRVNGMSWESIGGILDIPTEIQVDEDKAMIKVDSEFRYVAADMSKVIIFTFGEKITGEVVFPEDTTKQ